MWTSASQKPMAPTHQRSPTLRFSVRKLQGLDEERRDRGAEGIGDGKWRLTG